MDRASLLRLPRDELIDICVSDPEALKICGTKSFVEEYNAARPPVSMEGGRNQDITYPMHEASYYGKKVDRLGQGTYGVVHKLEGGKKPYAMKTFLQMDYADGVSDDSIREIAILRRMDHPNITKLIDIVGGSKFMDVAGRQSIILDLAVSDLRIFVTGNLRGQMDTDLIKSFMYQLSRGLLYLHDNNIAHRDLKHQNILVFDGGARVAIADFGLAKAGFIPGRQYTHEIQTAWWRAPEIFLGTKIYGKEVDIFSMGVIFAELFLGSFIFQFDTTQEILFKEISLLGNMTDDEWPGISGMAGYDATISKFASQRKQDKWDKEVATVRDPAGKIYMSDQALDIIKGMTFPNPSKRVAIREVMASSYFNETKKIIRREMPFKDNGPYVCGSNMDSSRLANIQPRATGEITLAMFEILLEWLIEVKEEYHLSSQTLSHARLLIDYYVSRRPMFNDPKLFPHAKKTFQAVGLMCLMISCKMFEIYSPGLDEFVYISDNAYTKDQLRLAERTILKVVNFDLYYPTVLEYMYHALGGSSPDRVGDVLVDLSCVITEVIDPRLYGYSLAYIILKCSNRPLPKCFYDEFYPIEKIAGHADYIIDRINGIKRKTVNEIKARSGIKAILNGWEDCKARSKDILGEATVKASKAKMKELTGALKPEVSPKKYKNVEARYFVNFNSDISNLTREAIGDFIREYVQLRAYLHLLPYLKTDDPAVAAMVNYFKIGPDGGFIGTPSESKMAIQFGKPAKEIKVLINFKLIPEDYVGEFTDFITEEGKGADELIEGVDGNMEFTK
jgi:serine/threonine protein kinase